MLTRKQNKEYRFWYSAIKTCLDRLSMLYLERVHYFPFSVGRKPELTCPFGVNI